MSNASDAESPATGPEPASPAEHGPGATVAPATESTMEPTIEPAADEGATDVAPAFREYRPLRPDARGLATIGIVVAVLAVVGIFVRDRLTIAADDTRVGDCIDVPTGRDFVLTLQHRPCSEPHEAEVVFVGDYPAFIVAPYPGEAAFQDFAVETCIPAFEAYAGIAFGDAAELDVNWLFPLERSWQRGDHEVACYLYRIDGGTITGSLRAGS